MYLLWRRNDSKNILRQHLVVKIPMPELAAPENFVVTHSSVPRDQDCQIWGKIKTIIVDRLFGDPASLRSSLKHIALTQQHDAMSRRSANSLKVIPVIDAFLCNQFTQDHMRSRLYA